MSDPPLYPPAGFWVVGSASCAHLVVTLLPTASLLLCTAKTCQEISTHGAETVTCTQRSGATAVCRQPPPTQCYSLSACALLKPDTVVHCHKQKHRTVCCLGDADLISLKKAWRKACLAEMRSSGLYISSFCSRSWPSGLKWGISFVIPVPSCMSPV